MFPIAKVDADIFGQLILTPNMSEISSRTSRAVTGPVKQSNSLCGRLCVLLSELYAAAGYFFRARPTIWRCRVRVFFARSNEIDMASNHVFHIFGFSEQLNRPVENADPTKVAELNTIEKGLIYQHQQMQVWNHAARNLIGGIRAFLSSNHFVKR